MIEWTHSSSILFFLVLHQHLSISVIVNAEFIDLKLIFWKTDWKAKKIACKYHVYFLDKIKWCPFHLFDVWWKWHVMFERWILLKIQPTDYSRDVDLMENIVHDLFLPSLIPIVRFFHHWGIHSISFPSYFLHLLSKKLPISQREKSHWNIHQISHPNKREMIDIFVKFNDSKQFICLSHPYPLETNQLFFFIYIYSFDLDWNVRRNNRNWNQWRWRGDNQMATSNDIFWLNSIE